MVLSLRTTLRRVPGARSAYNTALGLIAHPAALRRLPAFVRSRQAYRHAGGEARLRQLRPVLHDVGRHPIDGHYVHQAGWAARRLLAAGPAHHVDVGGELAWVATIAAHVPVEFVDVRPLPVALPGVSVRTGTATALPYADRSLPSISCLHVAEHVGLGRYGDPLDPDGTARTCRELARVADLVLLSLPIGRPRTEFNSQRITAPTDVPTWFEGMTLTAFAVVDDEGVLHEPADVGAWGRLEYGCGLYEFRR